MKERWVRSSGRERLDQAPQTAAQTLLFVYLHLAPIRKFPTTLPRTPTRNTHKTPPVACARIHYLDEKNREDTVS